MPGERIPVGVLFSQTGVTSVIERTQLEATLLAINEINQGGGINGVLIDPIVYDPSSNPTWFRRLAERLLYEDGVSIVFGCYMSSTRRAVVPVIERCNALLCYPTFYEGFEYSANVLYTGSLPNHTNIALAKYLLEAYGDRIFLIGSDYIFPRESNRLMRSVFAKEGANVVGEKYVPLGSPERAFRLAIAEARLAAPSIIFSTVVGHDVAKLYNAYCEEDLNPARTPIASITTTEAELALLAPERREGHISAAPYFATVDTPDNRRFARNYQQSAGPSSLPNMCAEAAYLGVILVGHAMRTADRNDPRSLIQSLHGYQFNAPQGPIRVDGQNNHLYLHSRIGRARADGQFDILSESSTGIKPDPYFVDYELPTVLRECAVPRVMASVSEG